MTSRHLAFCCFLPSAGRKWLLVFYLLFLVFLFCFSPPFFPASPSFLCFSVLFVLVIVSLMCLWLFPWCACDCFPDVLVHSIQPLVCDSVTCVLHWCQVKSNTSLFHWKEDVGAIRNSNNETKKQKNNICLRKDQQRCVLRWPGADDGALRSKN